jgi:hypothetical protein
MAALAIENIIFDLTTVVGSNEHTQSNHGPSPLLKLLNALCSDGVIGMGPPASVAAMDW